MSDVWNSAFSPERDPVWKELVDSIEPGSQRVSNENSASDSIQHAIDSWPSSFRGGPCLYGSDENGWWLEKTSGDKWTDGGRVNPGPYQTRRAALVAAGVIIEPPVVPRALTFAEFREKNVTRCKRWHPDGIESWSPSDWLTAVTGELGELASLLKMRNRERDGLVGNKFSPTDQQIADEIADVCTYLDLLAHVLGADMAKAVAEKFNRISERNGFPDRFEMQESKP